MGDQFDSLLQGQVGIAQTYSRLTSALEELENRLNPLIEMWTGPARQAYSESKKQWDEAAANLATVLNSIGHAAGQAQDNHRAAESSAYGDRA
jgi:WXG100 family type VII secretion target